MRLKRLVAPLATVFTGLTVLVVGCGGGGAGGSGVTARCVDGTYSHSHSCSGTCSSHGGVAEFYNDCGDSSGGSSGGGSGGSSNPPVANATYAGNWAGTWTLASLNAGQPATETLNIVLTVKSNGAFSGMVTERTSLRSANVTGTIYDYPKYAATTQMVFKPWKFGGTTESRRMSPAWQTDTDSAFNVSTDLYINDVDAAYGQFHITKQ